MSEKLANAINSYKKGRNIRQVTDPKPGQRVTALVRNEYGYYIPCWAEIEKVNPSHVRVLLYTDANTKARVSKESLFVCEGEGEYSWQASSYHKPCVTWMFRGVDDMVVGEVILRRQEYRCEFPELNPDTTPNEVISATICRRWQESPESFVLHSMEGKTDVCP